MKKRWIDLSGLNEIEAKKLLTMALKDTMVDYNPRLDCKVHIYNHLLCSQADIIQEDIVLTIYEDGCAVLSEFGIETIFNFMGLLRGLKKFGRIRKAVKEVQI